MSAKIFLQKSLFLIITSTVLFGCSRILFGIREPKSLTFHEQQEIVKSYDYEDFVLANVKPEFLDSAVYIQHNLFHYEGASPSALQIRVYENGKLKYGWAQCSGPIEKLDFLGLTEKNLRFRELEGLNKESSISDVLGYFDWESDNVSPDTYHNGLTIISFWCNSCGVFNKKMLAALSTALKEDSSKKPKLIFANFDEAMVSSSNAF